jgi:DNA-binding NarL/FixJ family response regulator
VSRVLIGEFGTIAGIGLRDVLDTAGFELVADNREEQAGEEPDCSSRGVLERLVSVAPDVVVLDLDVPYGAEMAELICRNFPAVKVIACSAKEPLMRIYPPFHHGDYYVSELTASLLAEAARS